MTFSLAKQLPRFDALQTLKVVFFPVLAAVLSYPASAHAAESSLAIINAGVSSSEDAPFAPLTYNFLPGDYVYFTFQIAGFTVHQENRGETRKISLHYELIPQDEKGRALTAATEADIESELSPEDKNWVPKRRAAFLLPSFVAAGTFHIHATIRDAFGKTEASQDFPFSIGGVHLEPASSIAVSDFRFLRSENDTESLDVPAYQPGDTVYVRFKIFGFRIGPDNRYRVAYSVSVLDPRGKPFIQEPQAANFDSTSFYPAQFVPGEVDLNIGKTSLRGGYTILLTVKDLLANQQYETKRPFSVE